MTDEEFTAAVESIHRATMNVVLPGGIWCIVLLGLLQIAAAIVLISILAMVIR